MVIGSILAACKTPSNNDGNQTTSLQSGPNNSLDYSPGSNLAVNQEYIPPNESQVFSAYARKFHQIIMEQQKANESRSGVTKKLKGMHAKGHGCLAGEFIAKPLEDRYKVGVFANSAARKVIVRLSNGSGMIESDEARDLRGMALKIFVPGLSSVDGHTQADVQDILATNAPGHHAKDIVKLMEFSEAFFAGGLTKTAFLTANPMIMARLLSQTGRNVNSLLSETYWSRAPFSFGKNRTVKYVLRPLTKFSQVAGESDQSAERLTRDLDKKMADLDARDKIRYGLFVQFQIDPRTEPVEDHFTEWQTGEVKLAEITFAKQLVDRSQSCESLAFNPWNAGVDHRPMGNMNRARKFIYEASVNFRK